MAYWQTPQVNFLDPSGTISEPTSLFLASMQAGANAKLKQRQQQALEQQHADESMFRRQQHADQLAESARDNERDKERIGIERQRMTNEDEREKARIQREKDKKTQEDNEAVYAAAQNDPAAAEFIAGNRKIQFNPNASAANVQAPAQPSQISVSDADLEQIADMAAPGSASLFGNPLQPFTPPTAPSPTPATMPPAAAGVESPRLSAAQAEDGAAPAVQATSKLPQTPAAPAAQAAALPGGRMFSIGGIMGSYDAAANAQKVKGERAAAIVKANVDAAIAAMPANLQPHAQNAAIFALNQARTTGNAEEAYKTFTSQFKDFFGEAGATERARIQASAQRERDANKAPSEGQAKAAEYGLTILDEVANLKQLPTLSPESLTKLQDNYAEIAAAADSNGLLNAFAVGAARKFGLVARSPLDGIPPEEQQTAMSWSVGSERIIRSLTGSGMSNTEAVKSTFQNIPSANEAAEVQTDKFARLERSGLRLAALGGKATDIASKAAPVPTGRKGAAKPAAAAAWSPADEQRLRQAESRR